MPATVSLTPIEQRIRRIQQILGVHPDGLLGAETLSAIESRLDITPPVRSVSLEASAKSLGMIVAFEITSKAMYEKRYRRPIWPGESSGVTIGIGYDIGVTSRTQIRSDWQGRIADLALERLLTAQGDASDQNTGGRRPRKPASNRRSGRKYGATVAQLVWLAKPPTAGGRIDQRREP